MWDEVVMYDRVLIAIWSILSENITITPDEYDRDKLRHKDELGLT
jgi:hypothetical protein